MYAEPNSRYSFSDPGSTEKRSKSSVQKINVSDYIGRWTIAPEEGLCVGLKLEAFDHVNVPHLITMLPGDHNRHQYALVIMQSITWCILQRFTQMWQALYVTWHSKQLVSWAKSLFGELRAYLTDGEYSNLWYKSGQLPFLDFLKTKETHHYCFATNF